MLSFVSKVKQITKTKQDKKSPSPKVTKATITDVKVTKLNQTKSQTQTQSQTQIQSQTTSPAVPAIINSSDITISNKVSEDSTLDSEKDDEGCFKVIPPKSTSPSVPKEHLEEMGTQELSRLYGSIKGNPTQPDKTRIKPNHFVSNTFPKTMHLTPNPGRPFRILAIDGGGVRGILPATILRQLEKEAGKPISEMFDLIAGTSTGAILAGMLTLPKEAGSTKPKFSADDGISLYLNRCPDIFRTTLLRRMRTLSGLASAQYSNENKRKVLDEYVGDAKITDLLVDILVPSFDIKEGKPYFFKSSKALKDSRCNYKLADVMDATSSAPTYFPPHKVEGYDAPLKHGYRSFVDGALTANSPALCALAEAYHNYGADPNNTVLVSLGCGDCEVGVDHDIAKNWGGLSWAPFFPNVMLSSSVNTVHYQLAHVVPPAHYFRLQSEIPLQHADIDNVTTTNLQWLADHGAEVANSCTTQLRQLSTILKELAPTDGRRYPNRLATTPTPDTLPPPPVDHPHPTATPLVDQITNPTALPVLA